MTAPPSPAVAARKAARRGSTGPDRWIRPLKVVVFLACLAPSIWLAWRLVNNNLGADPTAAVTFATGDATLRFLALTLAITPLRRMWTKLAWLIRFRRMLGLFAFYYGCLHLFTYIALYAGFNVPTMLDDIAKRRFIFAGLLAWSLMAPLALTSTQWSIRKLGGKRWQWLHRLIYVSAIAGVVHYWWKVKPGDLSPAFMTLVIFLLLGIRVVQWWWKSRHLPKLSVGGNGPL